MRAPAVEQSDNTTPVDARGTGAYLRRNPLCSFADDLKVPDYRIVQQVIGDKFLETHAVRMSLNFERRRLQVLQE